MTVKLLFVVIGLAFISCSLQSEEKKGVQTMKEISIIGNEELPNTNFDLPWRLPSVETRDEESPLKKFPGLLRSIEPHRYKQQIHFSKYLEVDSSHFNAR